MLRLSLYSAFFSKACTWLWMLPKLTYKPTSMCDIQHLSFSISQPGEHLCDFPFNLSQTILCEGWFWGHVSNTSSCKHFTPGLLASCIGTHFSWLRPVPWEVTIPSWVMRKVEKSFRFIFLPLSEPGIRGSHITWKRVYNNHYYHMRNVVIFKAIIQCETSEGLLTGV